MDRDEIEGLYRTYGPAVLRRARAILGDEAAARDAMQEVFVRAFTHAEAFRGEALPMTWLYRITTNLCLNRVRDESRQRDLLLTQRPAEEPSAPSMEDGATLSAILRRVPAELQEIAVYYFVDGMSHDEIAELLAVSRRTVGNRVQEFLDAARAAGATPLRRTAP